MSIEQTCENCEYEFENEYGQHCIRCVHKASDQFIPKAKYTDRSRVVDTFAENVIEGCEEKSFTVIIGGEEVPVISIDGMTDIVMNVAELVKGKYSTSDLVDDLANAFTKAEKKGAK